MKLIFSPIFTITEMFVSHENNIITMYFNAFTAVKEKTITISFLIILLLCVFSPGRLSLSRVMMISTAMLVSLALHETLVLTRTALLQVCFQTLKLMQTPFQVKMGSYLLLLTILHSSRISTVRPLWVVK